MATRIEILGLSAEEARVAFYYPVPLVAGTADPNRNPAGQALSAAELQQLKDGTLIEVVKTLKVGGKKAEKRAVIEAAWSAHEAELKARHRARHADADMIGEAWDGTSWSAANG